MDISDRKRRNTHRYVLRDWPKNDNKTQFHRHSNAKHHHSNGGHRHHRDGKQHHNHNIEKQQGNKEHLNHFDKSIDSKYDHNASEIIPNTKHEDRNHLTSAVENNHESQQHIGYFNHEIAMNHSAHHHIHSHSNDIHNATNLTHHHLDGLNSTISTMHHDGHHGDGHLVNNGHNNIHDHMLHSKGNQGHEGHMMAGEGHHHGMQMYFSLKTDSYFLLEGLRISSTEGILCAMLFTIALTIIMELLASKIHLRERHRKHLKGNYCRLVYHLVTSITHLINVGFAYIGMLCVMSMNIWLLVSVIVGSGVGHLLMKPMLQSCDSKPNGHETLPSVNGTLMNTEEELLRIDTSATRNGHTATETDALVT